MQSRTFGYPLPYQTGSVGLGEGAIGPLDLVVKSRVNRTPNHRQHRVLR
jgi:hypothetical protein